MGYTYIALMSIVSMINMLVVISDIVKSIVMKYKQVRAKMRGEKSKEEKE